MIITRINIITMTQTRTMSNIVLIITNYNKQLIQMELVSSMSAVS